METTGCSLLILVNVIEMEASKRGLPCRPYPKAGCEVHSVARNGLETKYVEWAVTEEMRANVSSARI